MNNKDTLMSNKDINHDMIKPMLISICLFAIYGFSIAVFELYTKPELFLVFSVIFSITYHILLIKLTPKSLKNDEIHKKTKMMSGAIASAVALNIIGIYIILYYIGFRDILPSLQTSEWFIILFVAMWVSGHMANNYYSYNPHKLP